MLTIRRSAERGHANHGWLDSFHTFSFGNYYDPEHMGFGALRVINDDRIAAGTGFGTHGHSDMEIITYLLEGEIAHKDSLGNGSAIAVDRVQRMSAGSGIRHSEFNPRADAETHLLQIWIEPDVKGIVPEYEEKIFNAEQKRGRLQALASPDGAEGSMKIHQDARVYAGLFDGDETFDYPLEAGRRAWVQVARGSIQVNGMTLSAGDALALEKESQVSLSNGKAAEVLVFDVA